ncbi:ciliary microtubule-associated protein 3 isoform X2 [Hyperolius riggenbachi]|uniref:ciliary microtubule-associated protein 3 isoform X2 n=1 Tax=Hyperolius riggenbachi TaxID=752182 RepID=UPI0035A3147A
MDPESDTSKKVCFGSTQDRKHFPHHCAPDRLGNELAPIRGAPNRGPGCYNNEEMETPSPAEYQSSWSKERTFSANYVPFSIQAVRFPDKMSDLSLNPGPGVYEREIHVGRKVSWPGQFGSIDWSSVPSLQKRTLRSELLTDREFRKNRNRVAYLSLYYS